MQVTKRTQKVIRPLPKSFFLLLLFVRILNLKFNSFWLVFLIGFLQIVTKNVASDGTWTIRNSIFANVQDNLIFHLHTYTITHKYTIYFIKQRLRNLCFKTYIFSKILNIFIAKS